MNGYYTLAALEADIGSDSLIQFAGSCHPNIHEHAAFKVQMRKTVLVRSGGLLVALLVTAPSVFAQRPAHHPPSRRAKQTQHETTPQSNQPTKPARASQSTPFVPAPTPPDEVTCTAPSCAAFNRLIQAKDRTLTLNLDVPHAYACFDPQSDRFLVVGYSVSVVTIPENSEEISGGWVSSDQYENGADVDSDMALGQWHAADSSPGLLDFQENSSSDNDSAFRVEVNDSLFSFSRTYQTIQGNDVSIDLRISLPSLQFSESYSSGGQAPTSSSGPCWNYGVDSRIAAPAGSSGAH